MFLSWDFLCIVHVGSRISGLKPAQVTWLLLQKQVPYTHIISIIITLQLSIQPSLRAVYNCLFHFYCQLGNTDCLWFTGQNIHIILFTRNSCNFCHIFLFFFICILNNPSSMCITHQHKTTLTTTPTPSLAHPRYICTHKCKQISKVAIKTPQ